MDPSTEQLIRDYLNRVAVAARRSMGQDEVRAFLARLRASIERQCTAHGVASPAEVASVLAALGGPQALVDLEHARLARAQAERQRPGLNRAPRRLTRWPPLPPSMAARPDPGMRPPGTWYSATLVAGDGRRAACWRAARRPVTKAPAPARRLAAAPAGQAAPPWPAARRQAARGRARYRPGRRPRTDRRPAAFPPAPLGHLSQAPRGSHDGEGDRAGARARAAARGPQGRDSRATGAVKRGRAAWLDQAAASGQDPAAQPEADELPPTALAFVPQPAPAGQRPAARPKFYRVRDSAEALGPPPKAGRPPRRARRRAAGRPGSRVPRAETASGRPSAFRPQRCRKPGTVGVPAAADVRPAVGVQPAAAPASPRTASPDLRTSRNRNTARNGRTSRTRYTVRSRSTARLRPAAYAKPALRSWPDQDEARARRPGAGNPGAGLTGAESRAPRSCPPGAEHRAGPGAVVDTPPSTQDARSRVRTLLKQAATLARRNPLEATAVVLLGLGGLIYPLIWLVGAAVALPSRRWDIKDKWLGIAAPSHRDDCRQRWPCHGIAAPDGGRVLP